MNRGYDRLRHLIIPLKMDDFTKITWPKTKPSFVGRAHSQYRFKNTYILPKDAKIKNGFLRLRNV